MGLQCVICYEEFQLMNKYVMFLFRTTPRSSFSCLNYVQHVDAQWLIIWLLQVLPSLVLCAYGKNK